MSFRVGVLGTGAIGKDHARRLHRTIHGVEVVAVYDVNTDSAHECIKDIPGAVVMSTPEELINSDIVDAIVITSASFTHEEFCLKSIEANKPVFVEKPLALSSEGSRKIVDLEMKLGRKLTQVGFMRRFDTGYLAMKKLLDSGEIGVPLVAHCAHRNVKAMPGADNLEAVNGSGIHEFDCMSWLLDDYFVSVQAIFPRKTKNALGELSDPQILIMTTSKGIVVDLEIFLNCKYGYDIQCEVVAEEGITKLQDPSDIVIRRDAKLYTDILVDWKDRFIAAYDVELQAWADAVNRGDNVDGPSAWDGYSASLVSEAALKSQLSGQTEKIDITGRPEFYR